jgi:hypothetical protein
MRFPQTTDMAELVFGEALRCDRTSAGLHGVIVLFIVLLLGVAAGGPVEPGHDGGTWHVAIQ